MVTDWMKRNIDLVMPYVAIGLGILALKWCLDDWCGDDCEFAGMLCLLFPAVGMGAAVLLMLLALGRTRMRHLDAQRLLWLWPLAVLLLAGFLVPLFLI